MPERPNILLITGDHMNWETVCSRTVCRTPNINRVAGEGVGFERSYTAVSLCCPSRAMLLSGAYPWHNGVYNQVHVPESVHPDMFEDVLTYSQRLRDAGYRTAYIGKWHASWTRGPSDFGYQVMREVGGFGPGCRERLKDKLEYSARRKAEKDATLVEPRHVTWPGGDHFLMWAGMDAGLEDVHEHRLATSTARTIREFGEEEEPWLIELHFPQPHDAYTPLLHFLERYPLEDVELPVSFYEESFDDKPGLLAREAGLWDGLSEEDFRQGRRHYFAYCEQLDHYVGLVLDALEATGQAEETLVLFSADHGDMVGAHHMFIKGWMPFEETHRIPMVARWPEHIPAGTTTDALVHLHDWAHTFCDLAGARPLPHPDGENLVHLLEQPSEPPADWPDHILNVYYGGEFLYTQRIAIGQRYKYVFNGFDQDEFYDLEADPHEVHNAVDNPDCAAAVQETRDALWELMAKYDDPYAGHRYGAGRYLPAHSQGPLRKSWD